MVKTYNCDKILYLNTKNIYIINNNISILKNRFCAKNILNIL